VARPRRSAHPLGHPGRGRRHCGGVEPAVAMSFTF
jgi:hypothetical protein